MFLTFPQLTGSAQKSSSHPGNPLAEQELLLYGSANAYAVTPYVDEPISELRKIPFLEGLKPAEQSELPELLKSVGQRTEVLLQELPNLIAREKVVERTAAFDVKKRTQLFNYLILTHRDTAEISVEEYRTDLNNDRIGPYGSDPRAPVALNFAFAWMKFYSPMQSESRFRYLGKQNARGEQCFVVSFVQIPGKVKNPGWANFEAEAVPLLYQGVAWIKPSDYSIVRLREDLLAPQPQIYLLKLTTDVEFSERHVAAAVSNFWLPRTASVEMLEVNSKGHKGSAHIIENHYYSNYHRYEVEVKIGSFGSLEPHRSPGFGWQTTCELISSVSTENKNLPKGIKEENPRAIRDAGKCSQCANAIGIHNDRKGRGEIHGKHKTPRCAAVFDT